MSTPSTPRRDSLPAGTSIEDPVERLREIAAATNRAKVSCSPCPRTPWNIILCSGCFQSRWGEDRAPAAIPPLFNFTVSNVVLSKQPLYLCGARLDIIVPISFLCDGYGLNVTLVGYIDKVALGFVGCRRHCRICSDSLATPRRRSRSWNRLPPH